MSARGCFRALAMARPRRAQVEREAIDRAFAAMPDGMSRSAKAAKLAVRVAREMMLQAELLDPMETTLRNLRAGLGGDPALCLAIDPDCGLHSVLERLRVERFRARGCSYLDRDGWARESAEIEGELVRRLTTRFRRVRK